MFEAMAELEALCAGFAAERMTAAERRELEAAHEELRALIYVGDPQRFHEVNEAFHGAIYAGAHNAYLAELTLATRARVQPFRRAQFRNGRLAKSHAEHDRWSSRSCAATATRRRRCDARAYHAIVSRRIRQGMYRRSSLYGSGR